MLAVVLLTVGLAPNVKAESNYGSNSSLGQGYYGYDDYTTSPKLTGDPSKIGFRNDWDQAREFGVKPIKIDDEKIEIKTAPGALVRVSLTVNKKTTSIWELDNVGSSVNNDIYTNNYKLKPTLANPSGIATFNLANSGTYDEKDKLTKRNESKAKKGDTYFVTSSVDGWTIGSGSWTVGESLPKDIQEKDEAEIQEFINKLEEKERVAEEQKHAEELFKLSIDYDNQQPWHKRWGDSIQAQWADFTGWLRG